MASNDRIEPAEHVKGYPYEADAQKDLHHDDDHGLTVERLLNNVSPAVGIVTRQTNAPERAFGLVLLVHGGGV